MALKFVVWFHGVAALSIVDLTLCESDAARAWRWFAAHTRPARSQSDGARFAAPALRHGGSDWLSSGTRNEVEDAMRK